MRLINCGSNQTIIAMGDDEYFFSYNTCVAGFTHGEGYWKTDKKWSQTTSRHINKYLGGVTPTIVSQDDIELALVAFDN